MTSLSSTPFTLSGGCFCKSIRYTISIPALDSRPFRQAPIKNPFGPLLESSKRLPILSFDHCHSCRHIAGALFQAWIICPQKWVQFALLPRSSTDAKEAIRPVTIDVLKPSRELLEKTYLSHFSSSENVERAFCGRCGTGLTFYFDGGDEDVIAKPENWGLLLDIALGTLDDESLEVDGVRPTGLSWVGDGIGWVQRLLKEGEKALET